jgi:transcriptional regulator
MSKPAALLQGTLHLLILKILALEPKTGWAISQRIRQMSGDALQASHGSLYPALHKLEHEGWITGEWDTSTGNRPSKVYSLTKAGRKQLQIETDNWNRLSAAIDGILESAG